MILSFIIVIICFFSLLQASSCNCALLFLVGITGYVASAFTGIMHILEPHKKMPTFVGAIFLALLGALIANGLWLDARYLGRISEYRFCIIQAILLMLFVILEMLPCKQPLQKSGTVTCDR